MAGLFRSGRFDCLSKPGPQTKMCKKGVILGLSFVSICDQSSALAAGHSFHKQWQVYEFTCHCRTSGPWAGFAIDIFGFFVF